MSVRLSCPSCNTQFSLNATPADRRATCPRCGDTFPVRGEAAEAAPPAAPASVPPFAVRPPRSGLSPGRALLVAVALGLVGLVAGLAVYFTRGPKPKPEPQPDAPAVASADVTPPARLAGLGYLPAECNAVFAVQPGPLLAYAEQTKQNPHDLLTRVGVPQQVLTALDAAGLPPAQIDHVAGGAFIGNEGDELRVAVVLVLKQPVANEEHFLAALKAKPTKQEARWSIELGKLPVAPVLAKASPTVWAFGLSARDFAALGKNYGPGGTQFRGSDAEGVRRMLASVPPDAAAWALADDDRDWTTKPLVRLALQTPDGKKWLPEGALKQGRGGLVAVRFADRPRLRLFVRFADAATGERVRSYLQARAAELEGATAGGGGAFAMFDAPFDPVATGPLLQRMMADAKK